MTLFNHRITACALLSMAAALPAVAASSAASSASDSLATSSGSVSGSIEGSSNSSKKGTGVAAGDYKIIEVAAAPDRPGKVRLKLQAVADQSEDATFFLVLPQAAVEQAGLAQDSTVTARQRAYGVEFSNGVTQQAFFLVLSDDWHRELRPNAVTL